jgi:prevent-host-death family protein
MDGMDRVVSEGGSMKTVGTAEARTNLPQLLDRASKGETIIITRRGVPIARLVPVEVIIRRNVGEVIEAIRRFRKERPLGRTSAGEIQEMINEGQRL